MRYVRIRVTPRGRAAFHPLGERLAEDPDVIRGAIHQMDLLADGTGVMLAEARGDQERYEEILETSEHVLDFAVTGAEGWWYSYTHFEPTPLTERMVRRREESEAVMEMPVEVEEDGSLLITLVGDEANFADAMPPDTDVYDVEMLSTGERPPEGDDPFADLTGRQREILDAAVRLGYYRNPREATHEDVAERVGTTPSTVGEHLRKIESRVFSRFVREGGGRS
ncbi:helix-turn-helix domain-containing protein [Halomicrobium salinisoli]|uniref:helix-turn-helix domain-containing protein n=1 Tax=Halomicrobium salinisoli TaxID=2878391 RepID=UPI001CEFE9DA|nr:helix-turn-helix domain-containing protein [Halomicrobium salinisoli]